MYEKNKITILKIIRIFVKIKLVFTKLNEMKHLVYLTRTGSKYHNTNCRCLRKSKIPTKPSCVNHNKYHPCCICHPSIQTIIQNRINKNRKILKTLVCIFMMLLIVGATSLPAEAPKYRCLYITKAEPIYMYNIKDPILRAVAWYESRFQEKAINPVSGARGILQITLPMIQEVNRILIKYGIDKEFMWDDAFNINKSIEIWYIVQKYHNPEYNIQKACQIWFGVGVQWDGLTWVGYYKNILSYLNS